MPEYPAVTVPAGGTVALAVEFSERNSQLDRCTVLAACESLGSDGKLPTPFMVVK
jgi:hypothetical protein